MSRSLLILISAGCLLAGCRDAKPPAQGPRPRIVSYSPALTDMLYGMGLGDHVVGVTQFCRPPAGSRPPVVGDISRISAEAILAVEPDVILIQQNPEAFGAVRSLNAQIRIEHFRLETLSEISAGLERIGRIAGAEQAGREARRKFLDKLGAVRRRVSKLDRPKVLLLWGIDRPATGGKGTFIDEMIRAAGGTNAAAERGYSGWKQLNRENILAMAPDVLICQTEQSRRAEAVEYWAGLADMPAARNGRIAIVTDPRWTIPSMRSADYTAQLARIIHPPDAAEGGGGD